MCFVLKLLFVVVSIFCNLSVEGTARDFVKSSTGGGGAFTASNRNDVHSAASSHSVPSDTQEAGISENEFAEDNCLRSTDASRELSAAIKQFNGLKKKIFSEIEQHKSPRKGVADHADVLVEIKVRIQTAKLTFEREWATLPSALRPSNSMSLIKQADDILNN